MLIGTDTKVFLAREPVDMRRQIDGLALQVQEVLKLDPFTPCLFAFCNKGRDKMKVLQWDANGFLLFYKRLEKGSFKWPRINESTVTLTTRELMWLLEGHSLQQLAAKKVLHFSEV